MKPLATRRQLLLGSAAALCGIAAPAVVRAQRPITIVDPATPGSSTDLVSRAVADAMAQVLGVPVVVENRTGAAGAVAAEFVARSAPDGHTLGLAAVSTHAANPAYNRSLRYDPIKDFAPISTLVTLPSATVVAADAPYRSLPELVQAARERPGTISFASPGVGSAGHLLLELFSHLAGVKFLHVPYRGSPPMFNDLFGGQLAVASDNLPAVLPHVRSGRARALVVRDTRRIPQLPDVPVFAELGFETVSFPLWFGLVAPVGTPAAVVSRLNEAVHAALRSESFRRRAEEGGSTVAPSTPQAFETLIAQWLERFRRIVEIAEIKPT